MWTRPQISYAPILLENDTPPKTFIHVKGDWREHGEEVHPGTLAILPPMPTGMPGRVATPTTNPPTAALRPTSHATS